MRILSIVFLSFVSLTLSAQDACNTFFLFENGVEFEYQTLDKKGKVESTSIQKVESIARDGDKTTANLEITLKDKKGKETYSGPSTITCDGKSIYFDISDMMPQNVSNVAGTGEVRMEGDGFLLPNNLKAGDKLPDSKNTVVVEVGPMTMTSEFEMTNFQVFGKEKITTPAGTFDAMKISYDNYAKVMMAKVEGSTVTWFAKGVGTIKTETYDKNGKLISTQELVRFTK